MVSEATQTQGVEEKCMFDSNVELEMIRLTEALVRAGMPLEKVEKEVGDTSDRIKELMKKSYDAGYGDGYEDGLRDSFWTAVHAS